MNAPAPLPKLQLIKTADEARRRFVRAIDDLKAAQISFIDRASPLEQSLLVDCKVYADRKLMMATLPLGGMMAEIGVDKGEFSRFILDTLKPKELHLFDVAPERIDPTNLDTAFKSGAAIFHKGDSSSNVARFPIDFFDLIYVDGDHSYNGVVQDLVAAEMKLKPGGFMVFNDYTAWSPASMSKCGVAKAVNEFANSRRWPVRALALQGAGYYDLCLQKPKN